MASLPDNQVVSIAPPAIVQKGAASAKVLGLMATAAVVSIIRAEYDAAAAEGTRADTALSSPFLIIAGATGATVVLVLLTDFGGDPGEKWGVGIAGVVCLASILLAGRPLPKTKPSALTALSGALKTTTTKTTTSTTTKKKGTT